MMFITTTNFTNDAMQSNAQHLNNNMKRVFFTILCIVLSLSVNAQVSDANFIVDYSDVIICGMDEPSFADMEEDWYKDKPEISGKLIEKMLDRMGNRIVFKKSSANTIKISVHSITDNGKFVCDAVLLDPNQTTLVAVKNIDCSKGGTFGSKLHLMKEGACKEGSRLGAAFMKEYKRYLSKHK